jgi:hypothetical protein
LGLLLNLCNVIEIKQEGQATENQDQLSEVEDGTAHYFIKEFLDPSRGFLLSIVFIVDGKLILIFKVVAQEYFLINIVAKRLHQHRDCEAY